MPIIKFDTPKGFASNTGSCSSMVKYLEKEDEIKGVDKEFFFNQNEKFIPGYEVMERIDSRKKGLGKDDAKFYTGSIDMSQEEIAFLDNDIEKTKEYAVEVFKEYASNFKREGLTIDNINWFAKLESYRYYKGTDPDVKEGIKKVGDIKPGFNTHVHFVVGRKSVDNKLKLSPKTNHRATKSGAVRGGFDREQFIIACEKKFDTMFKYNRPIEQSYQYQNQLKNGDASTKYRNIALSESMRRRGGKYDQLPQKEKQIKLQKLINYIQYGHDDTSIILEKDRILKAAADRRWNGDVYRSLLNLNKRVKDGNLQEGNMTLDVLNYVSFVNKPYHKLPVSLKEERLSRYIHLLNSRLPQGGNKLNLSRLINLEAGNGYRGSVMKGLNALNYSLKNRVSVGEDLTQFVVDHTTDKTPDLGDSNLSGDDFFVPVLNSFFGMLGSVEQEPEEEELLKKKKRRRYIL